MAGEKLIQKALQSIRAYHVSPKRIEEGFKPSEFRGSTFFASSPNRARTGAGAGMDEMIMETATEPYRGPMYAHEVEINPEVIRGLHYTPAEKAWFEQLPQTIVGDDALEALMKGRPNPYINWDELYDPRKIADRQYEYIKRNAPPSITYEDAYKTGRDVYGRQHGHYAPSADEKSAAARILDEGMKGYLVNDEAGLSIAMPDPSGAVLRNISEYGKSHGGTVEDALHAVRHHLAGGGFLSDLFSGPDYLSTGEAASPTNWGDPELASDFFKADKALRLAREVQAKADDVTGSIPARAPLTAPRPGKVEERELPAPPVNIPFAAPDRGVSMLSSDISPASVTSLPLAYTATPVAAPAAAAIDQATNKLTARVDPNSDAERASNVWNRMLIQESGGRQFDRYGNTITSPAGALGISQVMPSTGPEAAALAGLPWSLERLRTDPEYNHALGRAYYEAQLERFGDPILAAAAYNGGPGRVAGALRQARETGLPWTTFLRPETQNYVRVVGRAEGGEVEGYAGGGDVVAKALAALRGKTFNPTETGWIFKDVKKPNLTPAQNKAFTHAIEMGRYTEQELPIRSMYATQPHVNPDFATPVSTNRGNLPVVERIGDEFYVRDGHHRLTKLAMEGNETAKVNLVDPWGKTPTEMPLLDWKPKTPEQLAKSAAEQAEMQSLYDELVRAGMGAPQHEAHGGSVDDALRVVREHHADGEAVGPTMHQRMREAVTNIDPERAKDQPVMDPATMGEAWDRARRNYQNFPVQEGEAVARPLELGARDVIGGAIAGGAREPGAQFRRGVADLLVGSTGLPNSGTLGFGVADAPMITGIPLTLADMAHDIGQGDYTSTAMGAALPAAFYARGPLGAAGRRAVEIAKEYAKPAAAAATGVAGATVAPDEAEAAKLSKALNIIRTAERPAESRFVSQAGEYGYFQPQSARERDPRLWHPISNTVLSRPLGEMTAEHQLTAGIPERKFIRPEDLEGASLIPALGDRTMGGGLLRGVNDISFKNPVEMQAGHSFMYGPAATGPDRAIWASDPGVITILSNKAKAASEAGFDPYLSYVAMGSRSGDYSHHMTDALREMFAKAKVKKDVVDEFDRQMRENTANKWAAYADWPGLKSKNLEEYLYSTAPGKARTKMAELMGQGQFQKAGMPEVGAARFAITDPELLHAADYSAGRTIARLDPMGRKITEPAVPHKTYKHQLAAHPEEGYVGGFEYDIPFEVMNKEFIDSVIAKDAAKAANPSQLAYTYRMNMPRVDFTPQVVDRLSKFLEMKKMGLIP